MKRERIIDLGELIRAFWNPSQEEVAYEDGGTIDVDLTGIDTKVWDEAFKNVKGNEIEFVKAEKESQKESKRGKSQIADTNIKMQEAESKEIHQQAQKENGREIGE